MIVGVSCLLQEGRRDGTALEQGQSEYRRRVGVRHEGKETEQRGEQYEIDGEGGTTRRELHCSMFSGEVIYMMQLYCDIFVI